MAATTSSIGMNGGSHQILWLPQGVLEQIMSTHNSFQTHKVDLQHLVDLIACIFQNTSSSKVGDQYAQLNDMINRLENVDGMRQAMEDIRSISCEMSCSLSGGGSVDATTMQLLRRLKDYTWNAKVVLATAAFACNIGELSMLVKHRNTDPIAKYVETLKGHHYTTLDFAVFERVGIFKAMIDVVNTNLAFLLLPISRIPKEVHSIKDAIACFPTAAYNILHVLLQITTTLSKKKDNFESTIQELIDLAKEVGLINNILQEKLKLCQRDAEKYVPYTYEDITNLMPKISISELTDKIMHHLRLQVPEHMRNKHVLFLISDLDISAEEIKVLNWLYQMNNQMYEIVWLPIVDLSTYDVKRFWELKQSMKWSVAVEPSRIEADIVEFVKKEWHFIKQAIAVSVTPTGEVVSQNALPMVWTWGNVAFPFSDKTEQILWSSIDERNGWKLDLLLDDFIVPDIRSWIENRTTFVCLFGGGDIPWIQEFTEKVKYAAYAAGVSLKLVYAGKKQSQTRPIKKADLSRDIHVIESEFRWRFWTKLESILYSKIRHGKTNTAYKTDAVIHEALKVVGHGGKGEPWAVFSMGPDPMVTTDGETGLAIMSNYLNWRRDTTGLRFLEGVKHYKGVISRDVHGCIKVHLPVLGRVPGIMVCPECTKVMDMFYTYRCCDE